MAKLPHQKRNLLSRFKTGEKAGLKHRVIKGIRRIARRLPKAEKIYRAIIIGAGAGGLIAGRYLKDALILDKKSVIGKPVRSGEGISRQALERLGIKPRRAWISASINVVQRIAPNGKVFGRHQKDFGYIIDKTAFEKFLASQCRAEIRLRTEVVDLEQKDNLWIVKTKNNKIFKSKYLIGADGVFSIVRRKIFKTPLDFLPAIQYLVRLGKKIDTSVAKIYLDSEKFPKGYAWVFPKSRKTANIGLGGEGNRFHEKFKEFLEEVVNKDYGRTKILENRSGIISYGGARSAIFKDNALLVGDAAGLADPIFLGGINQAMWSGKIAAECILQDEVDLYESKIKSLPFADSRLIKAREIFYSVDNQSFNELGEVLEGKGTSYLKTLPGILKFISKPHLRKNLFTFLNFFLIWWKKRNYLW